MWIQSPWDGSGGSPPDHGESAGPEVRDRLSLGQVRHELVDGADQSPLPKQDQT